jgi:hypothetical protein
VKNNENLSVAAIKSNKQYFEALYYKHLTDATKFGTLHNQQQDLLNKVNENTKAKNTR